MKKIGKIILAAALVFGFAATAVSAEEEYNKNAIGVYVLGAYNTVGGIQYERRFNDLISTKFDTYIYYTGRESADIPFEYNVNTEVDFTLYEDTIGKICTSRLFAYGLVGNSGYYICPSEYRDDGWVQLPGSWQQDLVVSVGFGFDFVFFKHLSIPCQFGFIGNFPYDASAGFCGGAGLRYSW